MAPQNWDDEDESSFSEEFDTEEQASDAAASVVQNLVQPQQGEEVREDEPESMDEVDRRLKLAGYYRTVIEGSLFEEDDPDAEQVQQEIHGFVRGRLRVLMGMSGDGPMVYAAVKPQFSEAEAESLRAALATLQGPTMRHLAALGEREVAALRALAAVAMKTKGLTPAKAPPAPGPAPAPPKLRQKSGPAKPATPPPPAPKPSAAPPAKPAPAKPALARGPKRGPAAKKEPAPAKPLTIKTDSGMTRADGTPIMSEHKLVQKPAGMVPFPSEQQMAVISSTTAQMALATGVAANGDRQR